jgi:hypothetical protein
MHGKLGIRLSGTGVLGVVSASGVALVCYFILSFLAAVEDLPGDRTMRDLHDAAPVSVSGLQAGLRSRENGNQWALSPRRNLDIGVLSLELARRGSVGQREQSANLRAARDGFTAALRATPLSAFAWNGLTFTETALGAPRERVEQLFQMSIINAPVEERLGIPRLAFGLRNENWLTHETQNLLRRQIRLAASITPDDLVTLLDHINRRDQIADYLSSIGGHDELVHKLQK